MAGVLAIDVGTSSVRAVVFESSGQRLASVRMENSTPTGGEFDAEALWRRVAACVASLDPVAKRGVDAVAIAAHIGTVFVDPRLDPVAPARGWADLTGIDLAQALFAGDEDRVRRITRRPRLTGGAVAASLHLRSTDPRADAATTSVLSPKDFLNARLTGLLATDPVSAAYTGAFDVVTREWSEELIDAAQLDPARFPEQRPAPAVLGLLLPEIARRLGLGTDLPVAVGGPDGTAGAALLLREFPDHIADIAGTTDVLARLAAEPPSDERLLVNPALLGEGWTAGGPTGATGGALVHWRESWSVAPEQDEADWADAVALPAGALGVRAGTSITGSRFPTWNAADRGWIDGWHEAHGRPHLLRAVLEGAAYAVRDGLDVLDPTGRAAVVMAGGTARRPDVAQLRADVAGRVIRVVADADATVRGAALLGFEALGARFSTASAWEEHHPEPQRSAEYAELYAEWAERRTARR